MISTAVWILSFHSRTTDGSSEKSLRPSKTTYHRGLLGGFIDDDAEVITFLFKGWIWVCVCLHVCVCRRLWIWRSFSCFHVPLHRFEYKWSQWECVKSSCTSETALLIWMELVQGNQIIRDKVPCQLFYDEISGIRLDLFYVALTACWLTPLKTKENTNGV